VSKSSDSLSPATEPATATSPFQGTGTSQAQTSSSVPGSRSAGESSRSNPAWNAPRNVEYPPRFGNTVNINAQSTTDLFVLFGVTTGEDLQIAQIKVQSDDDLEFFKELKKRYYELRGFWRNWFGIWRYSHCDFTKVGSAPSKDISTSI
jgi:hypothetical protein